MKATIPNLASLGSIFTQYRTPHIHKFLYNFLTRTGQSQ